ncbi:MAG: hypothetical protein Q4A46_08195 [Clostridia bacterium]|nr:hypothetical protein [Clostridia bacterium]
MEFTLERFGNELYLTLKAISDSQTEYEGKLYSFITNEEIAKSIYAPIVVANATVQDLQQFGCVEIKEMAQKRAFTMTKFGSEVIKLMSKDNFVG